MAGASPALNQCDLPSALRHQPSVISHLPAPGRVIETPMTEHVAPRAGVDVGLSGGLVGGDHRITNCGGDLADLPKERAAPRRDGALHGARIPQGVPFVLERS